MRPHTNGSNSQNIGLQAKILSTRTFTIFVVMALLTTFATTPLVTFLYPPWYQKKLAAWKRGEIEWDSDPSQTLNTEAATSKEFVAQTRVGQLLVYLRLDNMPGLLNLVSLFGKETVSGQGQAVDGDQGIAVSEKQSVAPVLQVRAVRAHGLRLIQLGDRDSSVMTVSEVDEYTKTDPIVNTWRIVGQIMKVGISGEVATMPESRFAEALLTKSSDISSDLLLLPWSGTGTLGDAAQHLSDKVTSSYINFTNEILASTAQNVAIFFPQDAVVHQVDRKSERHKLQRAYSFSDIHREIQPLPVKNKAHRIVLPFFGGEDDRFALMLLLQLCEKLEVTAFVTHVHGEIMSSDDKDYLTKVSSSLSSSLAARVEFQSLDVSDTADDVTSAVSSELREDSSNITWTNLVIVGRRSAAGKLSSGKTRMASSDELVDCLGDSAGLLIGAEIRADILIVQARV